MFHKIFLFFNSFRLIFHIFFMLISPNKNVIYQDLERWSEILLNQKDPKKINKLYSFIYFMTFHPEYRGLFYYRIKSLSTVISKLLSLSYKSFESLQLYNDKDTIGPGLFIQHGICTLVGAKSIGKNCWLNQQISIGYTNKNDTPTLEDNVTVYAGAKIFGKVTIGKNSIIGTNCVVIKDVPPNCTVVGVPAYIIKKDGKKTKIKL